MENQAQQHPDNRQLAEFGLGKLALADSEWVEGHLEQCEACCQTLSMLMDDTFAGTVKHAARIRDRDLSYEGQDATAPFLDHRKAEIEHQGKYALREIIGHGGMGDVYRAEHLLMNRVVALKVVRDSVSHSSESVQRFRREVKAAAKLSHPNVVAAFDAELAGDTLFLIMEYVEGTDLAKHVSENGPLPHITALRYVRQVLLGLEHAHSRGIIHRDIKPQNLMLTPGADQVRILDFGLASLAQAAAPESGELTIEFEGLTQCNRIVGTPDYLSPEQADSPTAVTEQSDLYSLGCTLFFLLTGRPPYVGNSVMGKLAAHQREEFPDARERVPELPSVVTDLVSKLTAKSPTRRFQSARSVIEEIDSLLADEAILIPRAAKSRVSRFRSFFQRKTLMLVGTVLLIGAVSINSIMQNSEAELPASLEKLRSSYYSHVNQAKPKAGADGFDRELEAWAAAKEKKKNAAREYFIGALGYWKILQTSSTTSKKLAEELKELEAYLSGVDSTSDEFVAIQVKPLVVTGVDAKQSKFLVALTKPSLAVRANDRIASKGGATEPFAWDVQMCHAIALARAKEFSKARTEIGHVLRKIEKVRETQVNIQLVHYGQNQTLNYVYAEGLLTRSLIEALSGDPVAAMATNSQVGTIAFKDPKIIEGEELLMEAIGVAMVGEESQQDSP